MGSLADDEGAATTQEHKEECADNEKQDETDSNKLNSPSDILRLLKLIFLKKEFYGRFVKEKFPTPSQQELEKKNIGFWQEEELLEAFKDDEYDVGVGEEVIQGIDISVCRTKSAETCDLLNWYRGVERASSRSFSHESDKALKVIAESVNDSGAAPTFAEEVSSWKEIEVLKPVEGYKKILVTGGAGFVGSHVADYLLARGDDVIIVDEVNTYYDVNIKEYNLKLLSDKYGNDRLKIYRGDICDEKLMTDIFETEKPQWVCHMAARAGVRPSIQDPYIYIHSNIKGTTQLMDLSVKFGVKNFVFASSSSVYGESKTTRFSEDQVVDHPVSPYAASKKACELLAYTYHHLYKLNITGLRFFTVYGPRGRPDMAPYKFIDRCSRGLEIEQYGDGSSSRDYTYIVDIVDGVVRAIDRPYPYQIFNLGKGSGTSLKDFLTLVEKYVGKPANIKVLPDQPGDVPYTCADVTKAEKLLGYKSKVPFEEGIRRTVEWYQEFNGINS